MVIMQSRDMNVQLALALHTSNHHRLPRNFNVDMYSAIGRDGNIFIISSYLKSDTVSVNAGAIPWFKCQDSINWLSAHLQDEIRMHTVSRR